MSLVSALGVFAALCIGNVAATCQSYGTDYRDGGDYALQGNVNATFTANEQFTGCSNDTAHNVLVDPNGDGSECTQTNMQPDGFIQNFDCPAWNYDTMFSGEWSIIVLSNNGDDSPIAYQRNFYLNMLDSTATNPSAAAATTVAAKRDASLIISAIISNSTELADVTPSAFPHPTPSALPTESLAPTPSAFVPWKGGVTPPGFALPTPHAEVRSTQNADRGVTGESTLQLVKAILNGEKPDEEAKKQFVQQRKLTMQDNA